MADQVAHEERALMVAEKALAETREQRIITANALAEARKQRFWTIIIGAAALISAVVVPLIVGVMTVGAFILRLGTHHGGSVELERRQQLATPHHEFSRSNHHNPPTSPNPPTATRPRTVYSQPRPS